MAKVKKPWKIIVGVVVAIIILGAIAGNSDNTGSKEDTRIKVSLSSSKIRGKNYQEVETALVNDGFTNITLRAIDDLITGWLTSDGEVQSVSIDGKTSFSSGTKFEPDVEIIITYHTFPSGSITPTAEPEPVRLGEGEIQLQSNLSAYNGKDYKAIETELREIGFTNIKLVPQYDIVWGITTEGSIAEISINGNSSARKGDVVKLSDEIVITYHMPKSAAPNTTNTPTLKPTNAITLTPTAEPTTALVATPSPEPTKAPTATPSPEPTKAPTATPSPKPTKAPTNTPSPEPVAELRPYITGTSIKTVTAKAKELGLSVAGKEDWGHGTLLYAFENASGSITMDVLVDVASNQLLLVDIVPLGTAVEEQKAFILNIISVLCPPADVSAVYNWTETNIGTKKACRVNGIDYQLEVGPVGTLLMEINMINWENWDLSF